jgi:antitoxin VapB
MPAAAATSAHFARPATMNRASCSGGAGERPHGGGELLGGLGAQASIAARGVPAGTTILYDPSLTSMVEEAYAYGICPEERMGEQRHVRLFRNGRNQAVRIPVEFELPGNEAIMRRDGDCLVIEPVRKRGLVALLKTMKPVDEQFPQIDDSVLPPEDVL